MPGKVSVDPGGTRFLRTDPQKIDHVEFTTVFRDKLRAAAVIV
jgi:hypothetical protein